MEKVICIVGPTGVGKTALGLTLAKALNSEIISGDSIQVYRGMDIGSAKIARQEMQGIRHHLIDILDPKESYSVKQFQDQARAICSKLHHENKIPVVVGGTGLYIKALLYDYQFDKSSDGQMADLSVYEDYSNEALYERLKQIDPDALTTIHVQNRKRIIRALSIYDTSKVTKSAWIAKQKQELLYDVMLIGLTCERNVLHERIGFRVEQMFEQGLEEEIKTLLEQQVNFTDQSMQGIGYKEFAPWHAKEQTITEVKEKIKTHTRQFAKRQYTWFRNQMPVNWYDIQNESCIRQILEEVMLWKNPQG